MRNSIIKMQYVYNKNAICRNLFLTSTNVYCILVFIILHVLCHVAAQDWMYVVILKLVSILVHPY